MPPVNRRRPSPVKRRPAVAGTRASGADRQNASEQDSASDQPIRASDQQRSRKDAVQRRSGARRLPAWPKGRAAADSALPDKASPRSRVVPVSLAIALLMLVAAVFLSVVSLVHARGSDDTATSANVALVNAPDTQQVGAATIDVLQKAYSYNYATIDADFVGAEAAMTPEMVNEHRANFDNIRKVAVQSKTAVKATGISDAVRLLEGDRAEVIAFVVVTGDNGGTALQPSGYRFTASMLRNNGKWLLSALTES